MLRFASYFLRLLSFWLLFFAVMRGAFLCWNRRSIPAMASTQEVLASFWHSLPLDMSMCGYLMALPVLVALGRLFLTHSTTENTGLAKGFITNFSLVLLLAAAFIITLANLLMYPEWQTMLNQRALAYLRNPSGLFQSQAWWYWCLAVCGIVVATWLLVKVYRRFVAWQVPYLPVYQRIMLVLLFALPALGLMIRGNTGPMPISESAVYYSNHTVLNHAATNPIWHFMHTLTERRTDTNHYVALPNAEADTLVHSLFEVAQADTLGMTPLAKPNVVVIMMESMTAQVLATFGGESVCTHLDALAPEALLFDSIYSTGYRTDQGLAALLSGYPAQPDQSALLHEDRMRGLPSLPQAMQKQGYQTLYLYGGGLHFANTGAYVRHLGFDQVVSEAEFGMRTLRQSWGIPDHMLLERASAELNTRKQPFFAFVQTLSLHLPYDTPNQTHSSDAPVADRFRQAARYADASIGAFLERAKQESWYENTLFVLIADHGHSEPTNLGYDMPMARKVPFIVCGSALRATLRGTRNHHVGNHHDLAATLLASLSLPRDQFVWSRNLMDTYANPFAVYCNETGFGYLTPQACGFHRFTDGLWYAPKAVLPDTLDHARGQAYVQRVYDHFLGLGGRK